MAHFAELDINNKVLRIVVVSNEDVDANGGDLHADAETFVASIVPFLPFGGAWKQTSYNNNFRKQYAGAGYTYDAGKDKFILPQPYSSWSLDSNDDWKAPITYPSVTEISSNTVLISWNEDNQKWLGKTYTGDGGETITNYEWDATNTEWNEV